MVERSGWDRPERSRGFPRGLLQAALFPAIDAASKALISPCCQPFNTKKAPAVSRDSEGPSEDAQCNMPILRVRLGPDLI
jgi:hypothetical protein